MAKTVDVFGFDELEKAYTKCQKKYTNEADAFLMAEGQAVNKKVKSRTPVKTKKLRNSWRLKKVKLYKNGKIRVVREQSTAPHAWIVEHGHELVSGGKTRVNGKKLNRVQRSVRGIKSKGKVEGVYMLQKTMKEVQSEFQRGAKKILDKVTEDMRA